MIGAKTSRRGVIAINPRAIWRDIDRRHSLAGTGYDLSRFATMRSWCGVAGHTESDQKEQCQAEPQCNPPIRLPALTWRLSAHCNTRCGLFLANIRVIRRLRRASEPLAPFGQFQSDDPCQNKHDVKHPDRRRGFAHHSDAQNSGTGRADAGPNRVRAPHRQGAKRER